MTLDLAGYDLSATTITASTRGIITSSVAGSDVTCASYYQNGASASSKMTGYWNLTGAASITYGSMDLGGNKLTCVALFVSGATAKAYSTVAGARMMMTGGLIVTANGELDATNIRWIDCGPNWDTSGGVFKPGTNQVNTTSTGTTKTAAGQYFYDLLSATTGVNRTLLSDIVIQNHLRIEGGKLQGTFNITINGTNDRPCELNGTWDGTINITSTAASYTVFTTISTWNGTIYTAKPLTVIYTFGQLVITPTVSKYSNVTFKSPTEFWAGSVNHTQSVIFSWTASWTPNVWYSVLTDGAWDSQWLTDSGGRLNFTHSTWLAHRFTLDISPVITTSALAQGLDQAAYGWVYMYDADASEAGTWTLAASGDLDLTVDTTGLVYGKPRSTGTYWVNLTFTDSGGGYAWENWTIEVFIGGVNLHIVINWNYAGYLKMSYSYEITNLDEELFVDRVQWNFGDGRGSLESSPMHIYEHPGNYIVTVAVWDITGKVGYETQNIQVGGSTIEEDQADRDYWLGTLQGQMVLGLLVAGGVTALAYWNSCRKRHKRLDPFALMLIFIATALFAAMLTYGGVIPVD
jgi:hypothetical protein